jgi:hypothetical protein
MWGLYAQDPISGENAPAGPMYNRDGSVRAGWYDPLGFAELDKSRRRRRSFRCSKRSRAASTRGAANSSSSSRSAQTSSSD